MGKAYSSDLRERVVGYVAAGGTRRGAARHYGVSASCAVKLVRHVEQTGSTAPSRLGRPAGGGKLAGQMATVIRWVEAQPDITMPELAAKLETATGIKVHPASLSRALLKADYSFKKNAAGHRMRTR